MAALWNFGMTETAQYQNIMEPLTRNNLRIEFIAIHMKSKTTRVL